VKDAVETASTNPREEYGRRLDRSRAQEVAGQKRDNLLVVIKAVLGFLILASGIWLAKYHLARIYLLFVPVALFIASFVAHEQILRSLRRSRRLKSLYERGIARLENRWMGAGEQGERFLDPAHPYARDLDLFGAGSLFELLCTARTRAGEETLARWLLARASTDEAARRQAAVEELRPGIEFREKLAIAGEDIRIGVHPEKLIAWSESKSRLDTRFAQLAAPLLGALWVLSLVGWGIWGWSLPALCMSLINLGITYKLRARVAKSAAAIEEAAHNLGLLAAIFGCIEEQNFSSGKLADLEGRLRSTGSTPSRAMLRLSKRVMWLESSDNWFVKLLDLFVFWIPQWVAAIESWRTRYGGSVREWVEVAGEVEALTALAGYAYEHPEDIFPEFVERGPCLDAEALAHPLIPRDRAIANDLKLDGDHQLIVISGPNMAGKSTFIRSVGVNVVLAHAGAPVRARRMTLSQLEVTASICILDSLQGGLSRFYAEIVRLKQIDDRSRGSVPVLFLLDELLSGTNSHDRRIGTESFVRSLLARGAIGLVTTHDLALAEIAEQMDGHAANFHFEDRFEEGKLHFDYRLTPGVVRTTNALSLMRAIGIEV
jgi:MutS domain V